MKKENMYADYETRFFECQIADIADLCPTIRAATLMRNIKNRIPGKEVKKFIELADSDSRILSAFSWIYNKCCDICENQEKNKPEPEVNNQVILPDPPKQVSLSIDQPPDPGPKGRSIVKWLIILISILSIIIIICFLYYYIPDVKMFSIVLTLLILVILFTSLIFFNL